MFQGRDILCLLNNPAQLVCTNPQCNAALFVCSKNCECYRSHDPKCTLKNIKELSNGIQTLLKRNFCKVFKGQGIQIVARVARQTKTGPRNFRFCLTQCKADPKRDMQFLIRTLKGCVGVGVLHRPTINCHLYQYLPDNDYINHGAYMILSNGYQYSHSCLQQNFIQYNKISLQEGQKVKLYLEGTKLIIQQGYNKVPLTLPNKIDDLYYGVYLYEEGDEIQVLVKN